MDRYLFHVYDGIEILDNVGTELPDDHAAKQEAVAAAGEMLRGRKREIWADHDWQMHVTRANGETVCRLNFIVEDAK